MEYQRKPQRAVPATRQTSTHTPDPPGLTHLEAQGRALQRFTARQQTAQRQAAAPVLRAASLDRQEQDRLTSERATLQRQISTLDKAAPVQPSTQPPVPAKPVTPADWVTVMRHRAEGVEGQRLDTRAFGEFQTLQRQVAQTLAHSFRSDRGEPQARYAAYGEHLATLQRHPVSAPVARVVLGMVPPSERLPLQRATDEALQRQRAQEQAALNFGTLTSLQRQMAELDAEATQPVLQRIQARRGAGNPLPEAIQRHLEGGLNYDLSRVRIHDDAEADKLAKGVNAVAFTTGTDIFFQAGQFNPNTQSGLELLAHEVTHTVQQSQGRVGTGIDPDAGLEAEARSMGARLAQHIGAITANTNKTSQRPVAATNSGLIQRQAVKSEFFKNDVVMFNSFTQSDAKNEQDVVRILIANSFKRTSFMLYGYAYLSPDSNLRKMIAGSKSNKILPYTRAENLYGAGKKWPSFPKEVQKLFENLPISARVIAVNHYGGNSSSFHHRYGGEAFIEALPSTISIRKEVKFNSIGNFPKDLPFSKAKSIFMAKSMSVWSNKHSLVVSDSKSKKVMPIAISIASTNGGRSTINIFGHQKGRSNANGQTLNIYVIDMFGNRDKAFDLVAAHEVGHFLLGAKDEYKDILDPKTGRVMGAKSTTNDNSIMANFYEYPDMARSQARHFSELIVNFKQMFPGKKVSII